MPFLLLVGELGYIHNAYFTSIMPLLSSSRTKILCKQATALCYLKQNQGTLFLFWSKLGVGLCTLIHAPWQQQCHCDNHSSSKRRAAFASLFPKTARWSAVALELKMTDDWRARAPWLQAKRSASQRTEPAPHSHLRMRADHQSD